MLDKTAKKIKAIFYLYLFSSLVLDYFFTFTQLKMFISISYFSWVFFVLSDSAFTQVQFLANLTTSD